MSIHSCVHRVVLVIMIQILYACGGTGAPPGGGGGGGGGGDAAAKQLYDQQCALCHGPNGEGVAALAPNPISPETCIVTDCTDLQGLIEYLTVTMPEGSPQNCDAECAAIVAPYMQTFGDGAGGAGDGAGGVGDGVDQVDVVAQSYMDNCSLCHGTMGEGVVGLYDFPIGPGSCTTVDCSVGADLEAFISASMPASDPATCVGECATQTSMYVLTFNNAAAEVGDGADNGNDDAVADDGGAGADDGVNNDLDNGNNNDDAVVDDGDAGADDGANDAVAQANAQMFAMQCSGCHGANGEGGRVKAIGPGKCARLDCSDQAALTAFVSNSMPANNPGACVGECAAGVAMHIIQNFVEEAEAASLSVKTLLETRSTIENSYKTAFGLTGPVVKEPGQALCTQINCEDHAGLVRHIELYLPVFKADQCTGRCAELTAAYLMTNFDPNAAAIMDATLRYAPEIHMSVKEIK